MKRLSVDVTEAEHAAIVAAIRAEGMTRQAWLRQVALAATNNPLPRQARRPLAYYARRGKR